MGNVGYSRICVGAIKIIKKKQGSCHEISKDIKMCYYGGKVDANGIIQS